MTKDGRIRLFEIMQYEEHWSADKALKWLNKIACDFIAVRHDKDKHEDGTPKAPHIHIAVRLKDARTLDDISKECNVEQQYIEFVDKFKDKCAYLFHLTKNARMDHKYEYDKDAVIGSKHISYEDIKSASVKYDNDLKRGDEIKQLLEKYGDCEVSKRDVLNVMTAKDYNTYGLMFKKMKEFRILKVRDRDMKVAYITGETGAGKTTLAKYMARIMNYDVFVSGSGKDVLDGYDKEECIIMDDLRGDAFTKSELFKLTDNNTNSSVKSRFQNKDISFCKLMIITSIKAPHDLYDWKTADFENKDESFVQFARRIGYKFLFCKSNGTVYEYPYDIDGQLGKPKVMDFDMDDIFSILGIEKKLGEDLMSQIYDKITRDAVEDRKKKHSLEEEDLPF